MEHLVDVARRAGHPEGGPLERLLFLAGLLHDAGKAQASWQRYINDANRHRGSVPHAFLGSALFFLFGLEFRSELAAENPRNLQVVDASILQLTADLADHHGELKDLGETSPPWRAAWRPGCLDETDLPGLVNLVCTHFPAFTNRVSVQELRARLDQLPRVWRTMMVQNQARRLEGVDEARRAVVAARWTTARLIAADRFAVAGIVPHTLSSDRAKDALDHLATFCRRRGLELGKRHKSTLSGLRQQAQDAASAAYVARPSGHFYTLRLATGMGKTLTALRIGLEACSLGRAERIVYVAPYLSILSQAADEIRKATGLEVMEHHHLSVVETYAKREADPRDLLLMESWQAPIVATTFHQLFRGLSPRNAQETIRSLSLKRAFVILDEPQIVDGDVWRLFLELLEEVSIQLEATCLMITATMPPLTNLRKPATDLSPKDLPRPCRYTVSARSQPLNDEELAEELVDAAREHRTVAAILNTIEDANRVYRRVRERCHEDTAVFTLHGAMTSLHKDYQIRRIRERLNDRLPTIVVTTQIIEAGVDLSFRCIYRARPILPSLMQAAGRANRHATEGERLALVFDFPFVRDGKPTRGLVYDRIAMRVTDELLAERSSLTEADLPGLCEAYFDELFRRKPGTSTLTYLKEAALGRWRHLQLIGPFQERDYRVSVFVPSEGPWIDATTRDFLARFDVDSAEALYNLYMDRRWLSSQSFVERKLFMGLMQRFIVPIPYKHARMITNLTEAVPERNEPPSICVLRQPELYEEDVGFGNLVHAIDEWVFY